MQYVAWSRRSTTVKTNGETITGRVNYTAPDLSWFEVRTDAGEFVTVAASDVKTHKTV